MERDPGRDSRWLFGEHSYSIGWENLKKPEILAEIDKYIMSAEQAAKIISDIADGDMADLMDFTTAGYTVELTERRPGHRRDQA